MKLDQHFKLTIALGAVFFITPSVTCVQAQQQTAGNPSLDQALHNLSQPDEEVRLSALITMRNMTPFDREEERSRVAQNIGAILRRDHSAVVRAAAAGVLGNISSPDATAALVGSVAREKQISVRKAIAYALASASNHPGDSVTEVLIAMLRDSKAEVRGVAAFSLAERNDPASAAGLIEYLKKKKKDEDAFGRSNAMRALGNITMPGAATPEVKDILVRALSKEMSSLVLCQAAAALGKIAQQGDREILIALREATLSQNPYLVREAELALNLISLKLQ
ncbi:MAG: HEAT repeat domain-containing protein [Acidobacteria bacterium]|nr:HEAT repeat domain-containing protein [Acidobacteriota bacterium]